MIYSMTTCGNSIRVNGHNKVWKILISIIEQYKIYTVNTINEGKSYESAFFFYFLVQCCFRIFEPAKESDNEPKESE